MLFVLYSMVLQHTHEMIPPSSYDHPLISLITCDAKTGLGTKRLTVTHHITTLRSPVFRLIWPVNLPPSPLSTSSPLPETPFPALSSSTTTSSSPLTTPLLPPLRPTNPESNTRHTLNPDTTPVDLQPIQNLDGPLQLFLGGHVDEGIVDVRVEIGFEFLAVVGDAWARGELLADGFDAVLREAGGGEEGG